MKLLKKALNFKVLEIVEFIISFTIIIIGILNINQVINNGREFGKIILPENIKFLFIILSIILYILYLAEWITHHAWFRIPFFVIILIVLLIMLIDPDKGVALQNINIAIFIASIPYLFIVLFCIIYDLKNCLKKDKKI